MKTLVCIFIGLQQVDAIVTLWATNHGYQEGNPFLADIAHSWVLVLVKVIWAFLMVWLLVMVGKRSRKAARAGFIMVDAISVAVVSLWAVVLVSNSGLPVA